MSRSGSNDSRHRTSKRHRRSRSRSSESSGRHSRHKYKKKSKKSKHFYAKSRSRSRSSGRKYRRFDSRSRSSSRSHKRRSHSRNRRSYSRDRYSPSPDRSYSRRRRSYSSERRSYSPNRQSYRNSRKYSRRKRSYSRDHRSSSYDRKSRSLDRNSSCSPGISQEKVESSQLKNLKISYTDSCSEISSAEFNALPASKQAELRLSMALKSAVSSDKELHRPSDSVLEDLSVDEQQNRLQSIEDIDRAGFQPKNFVSSRSQPASKPVGTNDVHEAAMFSCNGSTTLKAEKYQPVSFTDVRSLIHTNLHVTTEEKMERWILKMDELRKRIR